MLFRCLNPRKHVDAEVQQGTSDVQPSYGPDPNVANAKSTLGPSTAFKRLTVVPTLI